MVGVVIQGIGERRGASMSIESVGDFGDKRLARRGSKVFDRIVATGSLVQRRVGKTRAGEEWRGFWSRLQ
jgi:hypothetical protein